MLSILIPVHNYDPAGLVKKIHQQAAETGVDFEIIIGDDESVMEFRELYSTLLGLRDVKILRNEKNLGRAATRNLLAKEAAYTWLLFIDADADIAYNFLNSYLGLCRENAAEVIVGGTVYQSEPPLDTLNHLRWLYGKKREERSASERMKKPYHNFSTFNFIAARETFNKVRFNEIIKGYGHEDTLFGMELEKYKIKLLHIDNPASHTGLETASLFLEKSREGVRNLILIYSLLVNPVHCYNRLLRYHLFFQSLGLTPLFVFVFNKLQSFLEKKLMNPFPKMYLFDLYRFLYSFTIPK